MTDITIPDAAVEAAAQVYFGEYGPSIGWNSPSMSEEERDTWRNEMAAYLLAAAPYIAAQALRDAAEAFYGPGGPRGEVGPAVWLKRRADQIEADHG